MKTNIVVAATIFAATAMNSLHAQEVDCRKSNASLTKCTVIPRSDGWYSITVTATADQSTEHGSPWVEAWAVVDGNEAEHARVGWEDGPGGKAVYSDKVQLTGGKKHVIEGHQNNENSHATGTVVTIQRSDS